MLDPNLVEKPAFTSAAYNTMCQALAAAEQITREAVATCLADAWDIDNNTKIVMWEQQLREDWEAEAEAMLAQEAADLLALEEHRKEEEAEKKEKEKKKL